jgi:uncharacterized protein
MFSKTKLRARYPTGMKRFLAIALLFAACRQEETSRPAAAAAAAADPVAHEREVMEWRENRAKRLKAEDGWLSLIGLHWLRDGENRFEPVRGTFTLANGKVTLEPEAPMTIDGKPVEGAAQLLDDSDENGPTIVQMGSVRFQVIKRGDRLAIRVKDSQAETRTHFAGLEYYPINPSWRVEARLEPYDPPKQIPITDITGMTSNNPSPGALVFTVAGKEYRLDPLLEGKDDLFIIFKDETSREETYPAGRYLYTKMPGPDGKVIIDFNKAYNPPCAFTPYATCPLPPQQNRLTTRIEAGEKKYAAGHA